ncbi:MAG: hypothetical protein FJ363_12355 [Gemmatimonadetes bacterium]|nr:hypothetical protein [Gemmatimonadota bacterium]
MQRLLILMLALPIVAQAQWQVGGNVGLRTRPDGGDGKTVLGLQFEGMLVKPAGKWSHVFQGAVVQMKNNDATGNRVRENSIEGAYMLRREVSRHFGVSAGPVLSYSFGCRVNDTFDVVGCIDDFAEDGTVRPGYHLQLDYAKTTANGVTWRWGVRATGHTVASGSATPKPAVWGGLTAPFNAR